jgi:ubiquinone/menaquinone biosynthesis C-methylase UbiE
MVDRGYIGTTPLGPERDDDAYLDFAEGLRVFNLSKLDPVARQKGAEVLEEAERIAGRKFEDLIEVKAILDQLPIMAMRSRLHRTDQEMMWNGALEALRKREPELIRELEVADRMGPGTVEYDPNFPYPDYFSKVEFHIQPGGYFADPLTGYLYHVATRVFYTGKNNNDDIHREIVEAVPVPSDGKVRRILDLACGVGQATTAFKERFPQAEVWGVVLGAPMVRYAHKRAIDLGIEVHFAQRLAERTGFPDNHFDIVLVYLLFHEIPWEVSKQVVAEVHRILRPGGVFAVFDFPSNQPKPASLVGRYFREFDNRDNGEPYAQEFVQSDFHGELRRYFSQVIESYKPEFWIPNRVAIK